MIIKALGSGDADAPASTPAPKTKTATVAASTPAPQAKACTTEQLKGAKLAPTGDDILLTKDKTAYAPSEPIALKATVKNTGSKDCSLLNNPHNVVLNVVSGSDRIFDSSDCAANTPKDAGETVIIKAGESADVLLTWDATRSQQGCRDITETPFRAKDATYVATVTILGVASDKTQFLLTP
jgi:hypothetical protein